MVINFFPILWGKIVNAHTMHRSAYRSITVAIFFFADLLKFQVAFETLHAVCRTNLFKMQFMAIKQFATGCSRWTWTQ